MLAWLVVNSWDTTGATRPLKAHPHCARLLISIRSMVRVLLMRIFYQIFNSLLADFCIWAPSVPGKTVGEIEGEMIAWCTRPGHGTRIMPDGTITGVQFTKSPDYVEVVGFMDQTKINMVAGDAGGEMDPHGADLVSVLIALLSSCLTPFAAWQSSRWSRLH